MTQRHLFSLVFVFLLAGFFLAGFASVTQAGITLFQDFDSGSLDVANSTVNGNQVNLVGRKTWTTTDDDYNEKYRWFYFNAMGVESQSVQFSIDATQFLGDLSDHVFVYSYDQVHWSYFDNANLSTDSVYSFSNNSPFTQDSVYVAYNFPYPVSRLTDYVNSIKTNPCVSPTRSASADLIIGQGAGGVDDLGRTIAPQNIYAFKITDPNATGPKKKVVLVGGNHSGEPIGNIGLEGMIDFLLSGRPAANELLQNAEFYVYPMVNPDGRYAGYYRSSPQNPDLDTNRNWHNFVLPELSTVKAAMDYDMVSFEDYILDVDYFFDFHQYFGPWSDPDYYHIVNNDPEEIFQTYLSKLLPDISEKPTPWLYGMAHIWATLQDGLKADCSVVAEFGAHPGTTEEDMREIGALYALALHHTIVDVPEPSTCLSLTILFLLVMIRFRRRKFSAT